MGTHTNLKDGYYNIFFKGKKEYFKKFFIDILKFHDVLIDTVLKKVNIILNINMGEYN